MREASLRLTTSQRAVQHPTVSTRAVMLGKRLRRFLRFSRVPFRETATPSFSCPIQSRHEALHTAAKRKRAAHRNPRLRRITTDATTDTESLRQERDAGPPPHRAARSYHARAQSSRCAMGYNAKTPRRTAMRARDMCSETAAHTQRPHATSHKSRTTSASSEGFGKVGIGQGLKTGTRRSRCDCSKASPNSALLI